MPQQHRVMYVNVSIRAGITRTISVEIINISLTYDFIIIQSLTINYCHLSDVQRLWEASVSSDSQLQTAVTINANKESVEK